MLCGNVRRNLASIYLSDFICTATHLVLALGQFLQIHFLGNDDTFVYFCAIKIVDAFDTGWQNLEHFFHTIIQAKVQRN
jgi:hypothetical protein